MVLFWAGCKSKRRSFDSLRSLRMTHQKGRWDYEGKTADVRETEVGYGNAILQDGGKREEANAEFAAHGERGDGNSDEGDSSEVGRESLGDLPHGAGRGAGVNLDE